MTDLIKDDDSTVIKGLSDAQKASSGPKKGLPPVHLWNPPFNGDIDMRIATDGSWHYQGSPITRHRMVKLFSTVLLREADKYFLVTPVEKVGITVDDAPFVAIEMTVSGSGKDQALHFRTNVDEEFTAGPENKIFVEINAASQEPRPYVHVRSTLNALITRAIFYDLVDLAVEDTVADTPYLGVWSNGTFFPIAPIDTMQED